MYANGGLLCLLVQPTDRLEHNDDTGIVVERTKVIKQSILLRQNAATTMTMQACVGGAF